MFRLVCSQKDTKASSFIINDVNKNIYVNNERNVILINDKYTLKECDYLLNSLVTFTLGGNAWVVNLNTGNTIIYNQDNIPIKTICFIAGSSREIKNFSTEIFIYPQIYLNGDFNKPLYAKVLKSDFNIIESYNSDLGFNGIYLVINDDSFISKNKSKIGLFNFDNEIIWEHSFNGLIESEKAFLHGEILEQSGKLFFSVAGDKLGDLFCLDVNSGMILHKFEGLVYTIFKDEEFIYTTRYENVLCKINPLTFEVEDWDVNELVKSNGFLSIQDHRCVAYNGKFYFTQTIGDTIAKLGILDTHKKELVYKYDFEPENGGIGSIQVKENRIFIHTQDNTLHIFEEE